ncbi:glycoside hydrolase, partial [Oryctes borbonicus]
RNVCGYQSCTSSDPDKLNVHIVPHSHDDVGWLKTVDQYYYGVKNYIQRAGVQYIIDSVISALDQNPDRRFIQVETAFFHKWWEEQTEDRRELFKKLVNSGRLEIVNGAWSMNDEAAVHYQSVIDQFTLGLRTINDTLGACGRPKIGWQIDPFGHSKEMASIFSQMGYDGLFFSRLDWRDKSKRLNSKTAEMLWQGSSNLGPPTRQYVGGA